MQFPLLLKTLFSELFHKKSCAIFLLFVLCYLSLAFLSINYRLIVNILQNPYSIMAKIKILSLLVTGAPFALSNQDLIFSIVIAVLFALNAIFAIKHVKQSLATKNAHVTLGVGLASIAATGCTSCGFSLLSVLGLGSVLTFLPFHGVELEMASVIILAASLYYNLVRYSTACSISSTQSITILPTQE